MKRWITFGIVLLLILSCSITAFAAEDHLDGDKTETEINVYVKTVYNVEGEYPALIDDGTAETTTDDGAVITVTEVPDGAIRLVVIPIPSSVSEAYEWFSDCLEEIGKPLAAYEVYFLDANGNRISADGATIRIAVSDNKDLTVCSLTTGGDYKDLSAEIKNGSAVFTANGGDYFILTEKKSDEPKPDSPQTGDHSMIWLWVTIAVLSAGMSFFVSRKPGKTEVQ